MVTSNANSGPGTLREALTLAEANGITQKDYIHFNLTGNSEAERTILLTKELPFVSSNVVIDGTTQPGLPLGISQAKICIKADRYNYQTTEFKTGCLNLRNVEDIEIYGLYIVDFYDLINQYGVRSLTEPSAIYINSAKNIIIGAPGKGNVFLQDEFCIYGITNEQSQIVNSNLKIQSNWFGLKTNGNTNDFNTGYIVSNNLALIYANDLKFGGEDTSYGNTLGGSTFYGLELAGKNGTIKFNKFGFEQNNPSSQHFIPIYFNIANGEFSDNLSNRFIMELNFGAKNFKILRNKELHDPLKSYNTGIELTYAEDIQIGSDALTDMNIFLPNSGTIKNFGSKNVEVRKNEIHCTPYAYSIRDQKPVTIQVLINNDTEYSGLATPNSEIYIYNDYTDCSSCSPLQFHTKLTADASGKWRITGDFSNNKFVANATLINTSSEFTQPHIFPGGSGYWYAKKDPTCGQSNGTIEVNNTANLLKIEWFNSSNEKVGEGFKIENLPTGSYYAKGFNGKCYTKSPYNVELFNVEPKFVDNSIKIQQPGCNQNNGSIKGLYYTVFGGNATWNWFDANNKIVPSGNLDLNNIGPGSYTLVVTVDGCSKSYGPIILKNTDGPNIDRSNQLITPANCTNNDGSIKNIRATGTGIIKYTWTDQTGKTVGQTADLLNVVAGEYRLTINDESNCSNINDLFVVPVKNEILLDDRLLKTTHTSCNQSKGSITGIISNANNTFKWLNEKGDEIGYTLDIENLSSGKYKLFISNGICTTSSPYYEIKQIVSNQDFSSTREIKDASCNLDNGKISLTFNKATPKAFKWLDANNQLVGTGAVVANLAPGTYRLFIKDENDCESIYDTFSIGVIKPVSINDNQVAIKADFCDLKTGSIEGLLITDGIPPYRYVWKNVANQIVGTDRELKNVSSGNYILNVYDKENCEALSKSYHIERNSMPLSAPETTPIQVCASGQVEIALKEIKSGYYNLYEDISSTLPLAKSKGIFKVNVEQSRKYYISLSNGSCESNRSPISIEVAQSKLNIPNSFSPNNDGINDYWTVKNLNNYPEFSIEVFNRQGQKVFSSSDPKFKFEGKTLSVGVYYYILSLRKGCPIISGSLTLFR